MITALLYTTLLAIDAAGVAKLDDAWGKAIVAKDAAKLEAMLSPDLIYGHSNNVLDTKKSYLDKIRAGRQVYASLEQKNVKVQILNPSTAITHSWMHVTGTNASGKFDDNVMLLHVWVSKDGGKTWQLAAHQTAKVDRIPVP